MKIEYIFRSLFRHRLNSAIIIISLAIGIACMNLIVVFVTREYNVDGFLKNKNRIYTLWESQPRDKGTLFGTHTGAAEYMKENFPEVKDFCRAFDETEFNKTTKIIVNHHDYFDHPKEVGATSNFFKFFSYNLILGRRQNVLKSSVDIVISQKLAHKYFGTSNPIGKKITLVNRTGPYPMFVTGVFKKPLGSSNLNFDMVILLPKYEFVYQLSQCYLLLAKHTNIKQLEQILFQNRASIPHQTLFFNSNQVQHINGPNARSYILKTLRATYFGNSNQQDNGPVCRNKSDLAIALLFAFMILGIALFNYLGLTNNRLIEKTKEFAIRQINGSNKADLVARFMAETFVLVGVALVLSFLLIALAIPFFNKLTSSTLTVSYIFKLKSILLMVGIPVLVFVATYLFAQTHIEKIKAVEGLNPIRFRLTGNMNFPAFNVIQLTVSVILIIASLVISKQINFIANKNLGLDKHVLVVNLPPGKHKNLAAVFKSELEKQPSVKMVSEGFPIFEEQGTLHYHYDDHGEEKQYIVHSFAGDRNYLKTLGIKIIKGKNFSKDPEAVKNEVLINEALARLFPGRPLIGHKLPGERGNAIIIGIVKDFDDVSIKQPVKPAEIGYFVWGYTLMVKPVKGQSAQARKSISKIWHKLVHYYPLNIVSVGDRFQWLSRKNKTYADLIESCCLMSIFLSMIGLFAVAFQSSQRRIKEIGIRRVNGATVFEIVVLLVKEFVKWVIIAFIIAVPISYYFMHRWLENFAYKTAMSWWVFLLADLIILLVTLITVSWQTFTAARKNPVEALRYE